MQLVALLFLFVIMPQSMTQAPGDVESFCSQLSASVIPQVYPPNSIILMDSYSYVNLLPPLSGIDAAWQQVDVDGVTDMSGGKTEWLQSSSSACRQSVTTCYFTADPSIAQNNWLITQHISKEVYGNLLPQVSVQIQFELTGCVSGCQISFVLEVWETSAMNRARASNTSNYRLVQQFAPNDGSASIYASIPIDFTTSETGFYLALVDQNTCMAVTRVIVFHNVCPAMVLDLIRYPETLSPPIMNPPQTITVTGQCVDGASGELQGRNPSLICIQGGQWSVVQEGTGCECDSGYVKESEGTGCIECPIGEYAYNRTHCILCPNNTRDDQSGVTECQCQEGYFRSIEESADDPCISISVTAAGRPEVVVYAVLSTTIVLISMALLLISICCVLTLLKHRRIVKENVNLEGPFYKEISACRGKGTQLCGSNVEPGKNPAYSIHLVTQPSEPNIQPENNLADIHLNALNQNCEENDNKCSGNEDNEDHVDVS